MNPTIKNFIFKLLILTGITFLIHILILHFINEPLFAHKIELAYILNVVMAIFVFSLLFSLRKIFKYQLGFLFILGSFFKFILFFAVFKAPYKSDGIIQKEELLAFFIPYAITLMVEVYSLSKWLNNEK